MLRKLLFKAAKNPLMGKTVGIAFQYLGRLLPVRRVYCSRKVLAFHHPQPSYENHIILSPRKAVRDLHQLASEHLCGYFAEIWQAAQQIHREQFADCDSFVLIANGGKKQEVQQVHFHLFTNADMVDDHPAKGMQDDLLAQDGSVCILKRAGANGRCHFVLKPFCGVAEQAAYLQSVLQCADRLKEQYHLAQDGYSLVFQYRKSKSDMTCPAFHLLSGKRRT